MKSFIASLNVVCALASMALGAPSLYFADINGNAISHLPATAGSDIAVYIYGSTDDGNTYDYFNLGIAYDPTALMPKTCRATSDLMMRTASTFGAPFGEQETTYNSTYLLSGAASSMSVAPEGFGPTLLATAYFTFSGTPTSICMFNEADDYTYSTFYLDTNTFDEVRFADMLTISQVPEPTMISIGILGSIFFVRKK